MKGINKLAAVLCLLMLPSTVFAEQTDRPQHPKIVVSSTPHDTPQTTPTNKTSVSAAPTKTNIPADVKIVSDLGSDFNKTKKNDYSYLRAPLGNSVATISLKYSVSQPHNNAYVDFEVSKERSAANIATSTTTILHIVNFSEGEIVLKQKNVPVLIIIKQGNIVRKKFKKQYWGADWFAEYKLPRTFFADAVNADETYIELYGANDKKIWVKIPQDVVAQFNEVFETDMKKKIKENE